MSVLSNEYFLTRFMKLLLLFRKLQAACIFTAECVSYTNLIRSIYQFTRQTCEIHCCWLISLFSLFFFELKFIYIYFLSNDDKHCNLVISQFVNFNPKMSSEFNFRLLIILLFLFHKKYNREKPIKWKDNKRNIYKQLLNQPFVSFFLFFLLE